MEALLEEVKLYQKLRFEQDGREIEDVSLFSFEQLESLLNKLKKENINPNEPNDLKSILALTSFHQNKLKVDNFEKRLRGALVGRFAGCLLGVPVEGYSIEYMESWAKQTNTPFPPTEYWHDTDKPKDWIQYDIDLRSNYTLSKMDAFLVDDDINFVMLNLLLLKEHGIDYKLKDVGDHWIKYLPIACTAEDRALKSLKNGVPAELAAEDNPFIEWIGAAIRADAFGYVFPGDPYNAVITSYNDAYLTHRRNGIYGELFCAAAVSNAFVMKPLDALKDAMSFIPQNSRLFKDLSWAFAVKDQIKDFKQARKLLDERFPSHSSVHTNNNMCALVFISQLGGLDYTKAISNAVALGLDNDCTAATIGSIYGAYLTIDGIDEKWYQNFNDKVHLFINGIKETTIQELIDMVKDIQETY